MGERQRQREREREKPYPGFARTCTIAALKTMAFFPRMCVLEEVTHVFFRCFYSVWFFLIVGTLIHWGLFLGVIERMDLSALIVFQMAV